MARRDNSDPTGIGQTLNWAWSWPANRRVLYNRASCDPTGKPYNPNRKLIAWNGSAWGGADVPDFKADENPAGGMGPFIMNPAGVALFFARAGMAEGPFPEHYEPFETPLGYNPLNPHQPQATNKSRGAGVSAGSRGVRQGGAIPARRHHLPPHRAFPLLDQARASELHPPAPAVRRIGEALAKEIGIANGERVKVSSKPRLHQGGGDGDQTHRR